MCTMKLAVTTMANTCDVPAIELRIKTLYQYDANNSCLFELIKEIAIV